PFPPDAPPLCLFLRLFTLPHLSWFRLVFRSCRHVERCGQTPVHYDGLSRFPAFGPIGHYFNGRLDSPPRREALADTASRHLFCGGRRRNSLLLESKVRRAHAAPLRYAGRNAALVECGSGFFLSLSRRSTA